MAIFKNGRLSGRVGDKVYYNTAKGSFVRQAPVFRSKEATPAQLAQRQRFAVCIHFLTPLGKVLNECFNKKRKTKAGLSMAVAYTMRAALSGTYPDYEVDPKRVLVSRGLSVSLMEPKVELLGYGKLEINWSNPEAVWRYDYVLCLA